MTEAYVLAGELNRAGHDYQAAYRRYEQLMRPFVEAQTEIGPVLRLCLRAEDAGWGVVRNQVTKLMAFPPLAHYFFVRQLRDDFDLPDYEVRVPPWKIPKRIRMRLRPSRRPCRCSTNHEGQIKWPGQVTSARFHGLPPYGQFTVRRVPLQDFMWGELRLVRHRLVFRVPVPEVLVRYPRAPGELQLLEDRKHAQAAGPVSRVVKEVDTGQRLRQNVHQAHAYQGITLQVKKLPCEAAAALYEALLVLLRRYVLARPTSPVVHVGVIGNVNRQVLGDPWRLHEDPDVIVARSARRWLRVGRKRSTKAQTAAFRARPARGPEKLPAETTPSAGQQVLVGPR